VERPRQKNRRRCGYRVKRKILDGHMKKCRSLAQKG
jgi:hypothetical protein